MSTKQSPNKRGGASAARKPQPSARPAVEATDPLAAVAQTSRMLFGEDGIARITLTNDRKVKFSPARMKHLNEIVEFFKQALAGVNDEDLLKLIALATAFKSKSAVEGQSQDNIEKGAEDLIRNGIQNMDAALIVLQGVLNLLPKVIANLCDLTAEEFDELEVQDGITVALGIFSVNYTFFTQSLRPILLVTLGTVVRDAMLRVEKKNP